MEEIKQQKLLSSLCHLSVFFTFFLPVISIAIPIAILNMSDDLVVKKNAKEAINYQANCYLLVIISGIFYWLEIQKEYLPVIEKADFSLSIIGFYLYYLVNLLSFIAFWLFSAMYILWFFIIVATILLFLMSCILPIIAIIVILKNPGKHYSYSDFILIIRFIR